MTACQQWWRDTGRRFVSPFVPGELYLKYDEGSVGAFADFSTAQRPITYTPIGSSTIAFNGSGKFSGGAEFVQQWPGGGSAHLDTYSYLRAGGDILLGTEEFYMEAWVYLPLLADAGVPRTKYTILSNMIGLGGASNGFEFFLGLAATSTVPSFSASISTNGTSITGGTTVVGDLALPIAANTWTHVAVSRHNNPVQNRIYVFVNGVLSNLTNIAATAALFPSALGYTRVGVSNHATTTGLVQTIGGFHGKMDGLFVQKGAGTGRNASFAVPTGPRTI